MVNVIEYAATMRWNEEVSYTAELMKFTHITEPVFSMHA